MWFFLQNIAYMAVFSSESKSQVFQNHAEYIMWKAGQDESQAGIKIAERNINNLRYTDDTTLMAKSEEELKRILMKVKDESEKLA